ncbi:Bcr/CflA family drug resistance efflux transporter [Vibrio rotiferianus]|uniref:multidrug effflux MFS transporter n=1 Tax=Vibrio rotiferianus TaxID=190895 RepID=UPI0011108CF3|nr:multidrug effflux MFS transporter [Vibrio rotiferianus]TMX42913.1 Bcr/CflA family drug resistance efflux transporter [Vibrio rotiferianus]TMX59370.1 Bcr/CflA family drug resistance efflux transporter [Vibrio rotiferianus]TMX68948.1 Bcr/CflA family drug resistance efflux transporter [Vibrio rotiferianus]
MRKTPLLLAMMIIATGQVGVSIYLPSLPLIGHDLNLQQHEIQNLVTLFLVGFGVSQLFYGPLSDSIGRRPVFIIGQSVYLVGTVICIAFADHIAALEVGRLLQGLGAGSASVLGRSVLRDSYDGAQLTKALSYISVTASVMPIVAPLFGGWIAYHISWHAVFVFVLLYLAAIFALGFAVLPETLPYPKRRFEPKRVILSYIDLLTNKQVIGSASYNWLSYLSALVTLSLYPFLMQQELGLTAADYGTLMIVPSAGLLMGSLVLNFINARYKEQQILLMSFIIVAFSGAMLLLLPFTVTSLLIAFTCLSFAQGMSFPVSISLLLSPHKKQAGAVSALSGSIQMCLAGLLGGYLVEHWVTSQQQLGFFYMLIALLCCLVLLLSQIRKPYHRFVEPESSR